MNELINLLSLNKKGIFVLCVAIIMDIVTGCIKAGIKGQFKSGEFRTGLLKKVLDIVLVVVGFSLDYLLTVNYIGNGVLISLIAMEFYSVLENVGDYIPLPNVLFKALKSLGGDNGNSKNDSPEQ